MSKTVTTFDQKSDQITQIEGGEDRFLNPQEFGGRVRFAKFSATLALGDTETCSLLRLPDCTIVAGALVFADLGSGTLDLGLDNGTTADPDALASAVDVGTGADSVALPEATAYVPVPTSGTSTLYATAGGAAAGAISGYVLYVENS